MAHELAGKLVRPEDLINLEAVIEAIITKNRIMTNRNSAFLSVHPVIAVNR